MQDYNRNEFIKTHVPCLDEEGCGSSDGRSIRSDDSSFCFSCSQNFKSKESKDMTNVNEELDFQRTTGLSITEVGGYRSYPLTKRGISQEVIDHFNVKMSVNEDGTANSHFYPYTYKGEIVAYKQRSLPKDFRSVGKMDKNTELFGQAQAQGGLVLIITEGEIDAMSVAQAQLDHYKKFFAVVSLASATSKNAATQGEWINSFKEVVIMVDKDEAGEKAQNFLTKVVRPGKSKIATLPEKDANDTLLKHGGKAIIEAIWNAKVWSPAGILTGSDIMKKFNERQNVESIPYPMCLNGLNGKLGGIRKGEITLFTSGTGSGKSTVIKEIILDLKDKTPNESRIGLISLEESPGDSAGKFLSMHLKTPGDSLNSIHQDALDKAGEELFGDERIVMLDHQGSVGDSSLINKIESMAAMGCDYLVLDHITIAVSEGSEGLSGNEAVDKVMSDLLKIVKRHDIWLGLISHLRKAQGGKSFEDGHMASIDDIKGSGSIKQVSFDIIAFSRNLRAVDETERNTTTFDVLKSRFTGRTGAAGQAVYNPDTSRLSSVEDAGVIDQFTKVDTDSSVTEVVDF